MDKSQLIGELQVMEHLLDQKLWAARRMVDALDDQLQQGAIAGVDPNALKVIRQMVGQLRYAEALVNLRTVISKLRSKPN